MLRLIKNTIALYLYFYNDDKPFLDVYSFKFLRKSVGF